MTRRTYYPERPLPDEFSDALPQDADQCLEGFDGYLCTRPKGHGDDHVAAGVEAVMFARWSQ